MSDNIRTLFDDHYQMLVLLAKRRGFLAADADELAGDTLSRAWETYRFKHVTNWRAVLNKILLSKIADEANRRKRFLLTEPSRLELIDENNTLQSDWNEQSPRPAYLRAITHRAMEALSNKRPGLARQAQAILQGRADHYARRNIDELKKWGRKHRDKLKDGTLEIQRQVDEAFRKSDDIEVLTLGVPFNWLGPLETLEPFYEEYYGSSQIASFHRRFGTFFYKKVMEQAKKVRPVKITYVTNVSEYWRSCTELSREWSRCIARDWKYQLRDHPQGLAFLREAGFETIAIFFSGRDEYKKVLFVARRDLLQNIDVLTGESGMQWVQTLTDICKNAPEAPLY
jgi:DNA-directed RNA polymerase specialized sigma24 family protein